VQRHGTFKARKQLPQGDFQVRAEDVARLSPLAHEHINTRALPVARGELRPLRNPSQASNEA